MMFLDEVSRDTSRIIRQGEESWNFRPKGDGRPGPLLPDRNLIFGVLNIERVACSGLS